jgi:hypothetical protein
MRPVARNFAQIDVAHRGCVTLQDIRALRSNAAPPARNQARIRGRQQRCHRNNRPCAPHATRGGRLPQEAESPSFTAGEGLSLRTEHPVGIGERREP